MTNGGESVETKLARLEERQAARDALDRDRIESARALRTAVETLAEKAGRLEQRDAELERLLQSISDHMLDDTQRKRVLHLVETFEDDAADRQEFSRSMKLALIGVLGSFIGLQLAPLIIQKVFGG